jgi:predicted metal-dependent phosphoesterase TrpH
MTGPAHGPPADEPTPPRFVDLQVHSTASDGALPPAAVVAEAKQAGLAAIALTDHDSIEGLAEAEAAGIAHGVRIVPGVELSTHTGDEELHLLGLHIEDRDGLRTALERFRGGRVERMHRIVQALNAHGMPVTIEAVMAEAGEGAVGRPHVARALIAGGWVRDFRDAFDRWIGWGRPAFVEKARFDVADAIALVHRVGGLAVWAHPGEQAGPGRIARLAAMGLDAIEVLHPSHPPSLVERLVALTEQHGLLPSGGSDWHGQADGVRRLGGMLVPAVWLDWQDARVAERRAAR